MGYIPIREAELKTFSENFASLVTARPDIYGLVANDAAQITSVVQEFVAKYELIQTPSTRTAPTLSEKDAAKRAMLAVLRGYAMRIKANTAVASSSKIGLGIGVYGSSRMRVAAPASRPQITVRLTDILKHELHFADILTLEKKAKPAGVEGMQLFCHIGNAPPEEPLASRFHSLVTRQPLIIHLDRADAGKTAYYYGRWYTSTGLAGPWSQMTSMVVAG